MPLTLRLDGETFLKALRCEPRPSRGNPSWCNFHTLPCAVASLKLSAAALPSLVDLSGFPLLCLERLMEGRGQGKGDNVQISAGPMRNLAKGNLSEPQIQWTHENGLEGTLHSPRIGG